LRVVPLLEVAALVADRVPPFEGERPYIATGDVDDEADPRATPVTYEGRPTRADLSVQPGDVCFARMAATTKVLEFTERHQDLILSTGFAVLRPMRHEVHPAYLRHWLSSGAFQAAKDRLSTGAIQKAITNEKIPLLTIPLPPDIGDQVRIAEILDKADVLRAKRRLALAQLQSLILSIFLEMFGDPATNPMSWPVTDLSNLCERVIDCPHETPAYASRPTEYPCIRSSDIQSGELELSRVKYVERSEYESRVQRGRPQVGDVVYCREGARFGNAARVTNELNVCLGQRMMVLRPDLFVAVSEYLWAFLSTRAAYSQALRLVGGSASPHVNVGDIKAFRVPHPPVALQRVFARRVSAVDALRKRQQASSRLLDAHCDSLRYWGYEGEL
jgi:type I restriction enzyme, S subunit